LRLFSFGGYGLALAALALVVFGAYDSYPEIMNEGVDGKKFGTSARRVDTQVNTTQENTIPPQDCTSQHT